MTLMGSSTRRLGALYSVEECNIKTCYPYDAHTTYTSDHASHAASISLEDLRNLLSSSQRTLYNEVVLQQAGPPLGFAIIDPFNHMELYAKRAALEFSELYHGATIVTLYEERGMFV